MEEEEEDQVMKTFLSLVSLISIELEFFLSAFSDQSLNVDSSGFEHSFVELLGGRTSGARGALKRRCGMGHSEYGIS